MEPVVSIMAAVGNDYFFHIYLPFLCRWVEADCQLGLAWWTFICQCNMFGCQYCRWSFCGSNDILFFINGILIIHSGKPSWAIWASEWTIIDTTKSIIIISTKCSGQSPHEWAIQGYGELREPARWWAEYIMKYKHFYVFNAPSPPNEGPISSTQVRDSHLSPPGALQSRRASLQWT